MSRTTAEKVMVARPRLQALFNKLPEMLEFVEVAQIDPQFLSGHPTPLREYIVVSKKDVFLGVINEGWWFSLRAMLRMRPEHIISMASNGLTEVMPTMSLSSILGELEQKNVLKLYPSGSPSTATIAKNRCNR